jgi:hypothetical protein
MKCFCCDETVVEDRFRTYCDECVANCDVTEED